MFTYIVVLAMHGHANIKFICTSMLNQLLKTSVCCGRKTCLGWRAFSSYVVEVSKIFGIVFMIIAWPSYYTASCLRHAHKSVAKTIGFELSLRFMFCINRTCHSSLHTPPASRTSNSLHERVLVLNFKTAAFSKDILAPTTFFKHLKDYFPLEVRIWLGSVPITYANTFTRPIGTVVLFMDVRMEQRRGGD